MRTLHECQAEVFRRSEERIRARRRAARGEEHVPDGSPRSETE